MRLVSVVAIAAVVGLTPASAAGGAVIRATDQSTALLCELRTVDYDITAHFLVETSSYFTVGPEVGLEFQPTDPHATISFSGGDGVTVSDSNVDAVLAMERFDQNAFEGDPAGIATLHLEWTAAGDPIRVSEPHSDPVNRGNEKTLVRGSIQPIKGFATFDFPALSLDGRIDCAGEIRDLTLTTNEPNTTSIVLRHDTRVECVVADGENLLDIGINPINPNITYILPSGDYFYEIFDLPVPTADGISGAFIWRDGRTGEPIGQPGRLDIVLAPTNLRNTFRSISMFTSRTVVERPLEVITATVTLPDGRVLDIGQCSFVDTDVRVFVFDKNGPQPGGAPPANDLPAAAASLPVGPVRLSTRGATSGAEAECADPTSGQVVTLGRTVWYKVLGDGRPVTIDTAGTDFDTVIGVYDGSAGQPLDCADDRQVGVEHNAFDQQAVVTFQTEVGHTYLLQIGGYDTLVDFEGMLGGEYGKLIVTRR